MAADLYDVTFKGVASDALRAAFDDCDVVSTAGATTLRCGREALRNVIDRIQDLGLDLLEVGSVSDDPNDR